MGSDVGSTCSHGHNAQVKEDKSQQKYCLIDQFDDGGSEQNNDVCRKTYGNFSSGGAHKTRLLIAFVMSIAFLLVELVGGILAHSVAVQADAAHMFSDASSFLLSFLAAVLATRKPCAKYTFGHARVEVVGAAGSIMIIWCVTVWLVFEAIQRIIWPPESINGKLMFIIAVIGIIFNALLFLVLGVHSHGPGSNTCSNSCSHSHTHAGGHSHAHAPHSNTCCSDTYHTETHRHARSLSQSTTPSISHSQDDEEEPLNPTALATCSHPRRGGKSSKRDNHTFFSSETSRHAYVATAQPHQCGSNSNCNSAQVGPGILHSTFERHAMGGTAASQPGYVALDDSRASIEPLDIEAPVRIDSTSGIEPSPNKIPAHHAPYQSPKAPHAPHSNVNIRGAILHVISDFIQSIGVAVAGLVIWLTNDNQKWYVVDPLCTLFFAVLVFFSTKGLSKEIYRVLMQGAPMGLDVEELRQAMLKKVGVQNVHDIHVWEVTPGQVVMSAHVMVWRGVDVDAELMELNEIVANNGIVHSTIQICRGSELRPVGVGLACV